MFTNISYGTYDVEVSAVGFFSARKELLISPASVQMEIDIVLQRDPAAVSLDVNANTLSPKARKETKHAVQAQLEGSRKAPRGSLQSGSG
jgi:hypothetical protein